MTVWPELSTDVESVLAPLPADGPAELVREDANGSITSAITDETRYREPAALLPGARAAAALSLAVDERPPLFTAVLPDSDGVLRARWRTEPTRDRRRHVDHPSDVLGVGQEITAKILDFDMA
ncbi:hypothetical protein [Streptomyces sp. NPDC058964]|uniref:hypothetical protein n=1 Tax=Streptomyces sp. NPDC058964 TaxID=3346681 RepID=UPI003676FC73